MADSLGHHIKKYFQEGEELPKQELLFHVKEDFPHWSDNTISKYLSRLKKEGKIYTSSKGVYKLSRKAKFIPFVFDEVIGLYNNIHQKFPYITFCVWDSFWFNSLMKHQPFSHYLVVEVERVASESVFSFLSSNMEKVFLNPDEGIFKRYIRNFEEVIIVKNLISEAPLMEVQEIVVPTLEKLLVDNIAEGDMFSAQQDENGFIMRSAMEKYALNVPKMKRYANRRNKLSDINELLHLRMDT